MPTPPPLLTRYRSRVCSCSQFCPTLQLPRHPIPPTSADAPAMKIFPGSTVVCSDDRFCGATREREATEVELGRPRRRAKSKVFFLFRVKPVGGAQADSPLEGFTSPRAVRRTGNGGAEQPRPFPVPHPVHGPPNGNGRCRGSKGPPTKGGGRGTAAPPSELRARAAYTAQRGKGNQRRPTSPPTPMLESSGSLTDREGSVNRPRFRRKAPVATPLRRTIPDCTAGDDPVEVGVANSIP